VETRLFMRHSDGNWAGYTYEWNAGGTDATRVVGGKTVQVAGQTWEFPSEVQCLQCHSAAAGRTLGLEIGQLNGDFGYPTGRTANQLTTLNSIDTLTPALTLPPAQLPVIPDPFGNAALGSRARAYLHTNCSHCHRPTGPAPSDLDFRYTTALNATNACDITPTLGNLGITDARIIAPGSAARYDRHRGSAAADRLDCWLGELQLGNSELAALLASRAFLFELQNRLPARHGHLALDARAIRDRQDLRDDLARDHRTRTDLELVFHDDLADDLARNHRLACRDVAFPVGTLAHGERAADRAVALNVARDHERSARLDVADDGGAFGDDGGRHAQSIGKSAFGFFAHVHLQSAAAFTIKRCSRGS